MPKLFYTRQCDWLQLCFSDMVMPRPAASALCRPHLNHHGTQAGSLKLAAMLATAASSGTVGGSLARRLLHSSSLCCLPCD
jgi:hypothetical protein